MDDWEREYEEDRKRLAGGGTIDVNARARRFEQHEDPFSEPAAVAAGSESGFVRHNAEGAGNSGPVNAHPSATYATSAPLAQVPGSTPSLNLQGSREKKDDEISKIYAHYDESGDVRHAAREPTVSVVAPSLKLPRVILKGSLQTLFQSKLGRELYFAETAKSVFKGLFSHSESIIACFITANCLYVGDVSTGELIIGIDILGLLSAYMFPNSVALRAMDTTELFLLLTGDQREKVVSILDGIWGAAGASLPLIKGSTADEKAFRKEMKPPNRKSATWNLVEDPRTGLRFISIGKAHASAYACLSPKMIHWFGELYHVSRDWKNSKFKERAGAWMTNQCLFLSQPSGPKPNGKNIKRCLGVEFMSEILDGPNGTLAIIVNGGPPQPPLSVVLDSDDEKGCLLRVIETVRSLRNPNGTLVIRKVANVDAIISVEREKNFTPFLFIMRDRQELYHVLRKPTQAQKM